MPLLCISSVAVAQAVLARAYFTEYDVSMSEAALELSKYDDDGVPWWTEEGEDTPEEIAARPDLNYM